MGAEEAARLGLVCRTADCAVSAARELAVQICSSGPIAVRTTTATLRAAAGVGLEAAYSTEAAAQAVCYPTGDLAEGVTALQKRRPPVFKGK